MFVSYRTSEGSYGYMCFTDGYVKVDKLHEYIERRLFGQVQIHFITHYSNKKEHWVSTHTEGVYRTELMDINLKDAEGVGDLYTFLYRKYGFTNILNFL